MTSYVIWYKRVNNGKWIEHEMIADSIDELLGYVALLALEIRSLKVVINSIHVA